MVGHDFQFVNNVPSENSLAKGAGDGEQGMESRPANIPDPYNLIARVILAAAWAWPY